MALRPSDVFCRLWKTLRGLIIMTAPRTLKQNVVFSPVLLDRRSVEDLERQPEDAGHVTCRLLHVPPRDLQGSSASPGPGGPRHANHVNFTPYHVSLATFPIFLHHRVTSPTGILHDASCCEIKCGTPKTSQQPLKSPFPKYHLS